MNKIQTALCFSVFGFLTFLLPPAEAQQQTAQQEEAAQRREEEREVRREEQEEVWKEKTMPQTAEEILEMIKAQAKEKIAERKRAQLLKTRKSAGLTYIFEDNPLTAAKGSEEPDPSLEKSFSFSWTPTFSKSLSGNTGYSVTDTNYFGEESLSSQNHLINTDLTYKALNGRLHINPSLKYEWMIYPLDTSSRYDQIKPSLKLTHYLGKSLNYGTKYEYGVKEYPKKASRDEIGNNLDFRTKHWRHSIEFWVSKTFGKTTVKLKEKSFRNKSNDEYQNYNDYDSHKGEITVSRSFLKDDKLYTSITSDFETKNYFDRLGSSTNAKWDHIGTHRLSTNYKLTKNWKATYNYTFKLANSNTTTAVYQAQTHKAGLSLDF